MPIKFYIVGGAVICVLFAVFYIFNEGKSAGTAAVTGAVQSETIRATEAARATKERADADVRAMPYGEKVDGVR